MKELPAILKVSQKCQGSVGVQNILDMDTAVVLVFVLPSYVCIRMCVYLCTSAQNIYAITIKTHDSDFASKFITSKTKKLQSCVCLETCIRVCFQLTTCFLVFYYLTFLHYFQTLDQADSGQYNFSVNVSIMTAQEQAQNSCLRI